MHFYRYSRTSPLSGSVIPLDLVPSALGVFISHLPFRYVFYGPISLLLGRTSPSAGLDMVTNAYWWTLLMLVLVGGLWSRMVRRYDSPKA
ncbi:MAG: ABC-2 family transporter protein [Bacillota bacterium]